MYATFPLATSRFSPKAPYDATRRIRETDWGKQILIVALTGWGQPDDLRASSEAGCSAHLVKPVDLARLDQLFQAKLC